MSKEHKHSPLPWSGHVTSKYLTSKTEESKGPSDGFIFSRDMPEELAISHAEALANRDFIFTACNSHYELVEALEWAMPLAVKTIESNSASHPDDLPAISVNGNLVYGMCQGDMDEIDKARAALTKARGEQS